MVLPLPLPVGLVPTVGVDVDREEGSCSSRIRGRGGRVSALCEGLKGVCGGGGGLMYMRCRGLILNAASICYQWQSAPMS